MSARQFGRSSFKPSHLGVGGSRGGDEENTLNQILDDEGDAPSSAKASSSAAFMRLAGVQRDSFETMNVQKYPQTASSDIDKRPMSGEDPEEELVAAEELDKLLDNDSDGSDNDMDEEVNTKEKNIKENETQEATQDLNHADDVDSDSDDDNMRDLSQAAEARSRHNDDDMGGLSQATYATNTQSIDDLFGDSESEDEMPIKSASQSMNHLPEPKLSQQTDADMFSDGESEVDITSTKISKDGGNSSGEYNSNTLESANGLDLDDDSVQIERESGGDEGHDDETLTTEGLRGSKKDKGGKSKKRLNKKRSSGTNDGDDDSEDEDIVDDEPVTTKPTSLETEIDAIRAVDDGPSAEDLEREKMFKVDRDEIDRKLDVINSEVRAMMQKKLLGADEQRAKLQEMRVWFKQVRGSSNEELLDFVRDEMLSSLRAVRGGEGERYMASLEQFLARAENIEDSDVDFDPKEFDDDDDDDEEDNGNEEPGKGTKDENLVQESEVVEFSDSEDDEDDEGDDNNGGDREDEEDPLTKQKSVEVDDPEKGATAHDASNTVEVSKLVLPLDRDLTEGDGIIPLPDVVQKGAPPFAQQSQQSIEVHVVHRVTPDVKQRSSATMSKQQMRQRFMMATKTVRGLAGSTAMKPDLKKELKRAQKAKIENTALRSFSRMYCRRIDLESQKEIASKCRALSDLFFQRVERKMAVRKLREHARREKLRREYFRSANDEEGELDDAEMDMDGRFVAAELTEEEQQAAEQRFIEEGMRLEEEAEAAEMEDSYAYENDDEDNEGMEGEAAEESAQADGGEEEVVTEENEEVALARSIQKKVALDDDHLDSVPSAAQSSWVEAENDATGTQTQTQTQTQTEQAEVTPATANEVNENDVVVASSDEDDEEEVRRRAPTKEELLRAELIKRARKQGKTLYQLQVEEEERRARAEKRGGLFETEAEEEEESGLQAGLEDFGFGTSKQREGDEERDALKIRAGDFQGIADDLSDDEKENRDEDAAARFRAKQAELDDMMAAKRIIKGDLGKKNKGRGALSEEFLAGAETEAQLDPDADIEDQIADIDKKLKEFSEEDLLAQIQEEKRAKQAQMAVLAEDSDSDAEDDSDDDDNDPDEAFMTNEQKELYRAEKARLKEQKQKARIQQAEFKALARSRRFFRQESTRKAREEEMRLRRLGSTVGGDQLGSDQAQAQNVPSDSIGAIDTTSSASVPSLKRNASTAALYRQPSLQRVGSHGALPSQPIQRSTSNGHIPNTGISRQSSLVRKPSLVRSRSHLGEKTTLVRQQSLVGLTGELTGTEKLAFKRQRSQLAVRSNSVKGANVTSHASNASAAHAFLFRKQGP